MTRIAVLMTCYNRREKTLACLAALYRNHLPACTSLGVVLVDDGSADGTAEAVGNAYPDVRIVRGNGSLFWNGGMRLAWEVAQTRPYDYLLWLNDDTQLNDDAIGRLFATEAQLRKRLGRPAIIAGSTHTPGSEIPSYGGEARPDRFRPMYFEKIQPGEEAVECDTMHGNCVLVPREISLAVGNLDPRFVHAMGDLDYGLRAKASGYSVWVMPGYAGICVNDNPITGSFNDATLPLAARLRKMLSPKGLPPRSWLVMTRRHAGALWPLHWVWPYFKVIVTSCCAARGVSMRFCIPRVHGRGAGLGNEMIPWAKAFIASQELGATLLHPAWGLNQRGYRRYFATSRLDWMLPKVLGAVLPTYTFTFADYRQSGELEFGAAVRVFARRRGLVEKGAYVLFLEGMWGGYESVRGAKDFLRGVLHATRYTQANLYDLHRRLDGEKLQVAVHVRMGDFTQTAADTVYRGKFNVSLPLEWYVNVCRSLRAAMGMNVDFILFTDGDESALAKFIAEFQPVTTLRQSNTDCSDLLAMAAADLLVCSVSSYSMWAAFLSGKPYLWFRPNLQQTDGVFTIWGHEPAQQLPHSLTARNIAKMQQYARDNGSRGVPVGMDGRLPDALIQRLREAVSIKSGTTDLIRYGATKSHEANMDLA